LFGDVWRTAVTTVVGTIVGTLLTAGIAYAISHIGHHDNTPKAAVSGDVSFKAVSDPNVTLAEFRLDHPEAGSGESGSDPDHLGVVLHLDLDLKNARRHGAALAWTVRSGSDRKPLADEKSLPIAAATADDQPYTCWIWAPYPTTTESMFVRARLLVADKERDVDESPTITLGGIESNPAAEPQSQGVAACQ
jgi:hypothetical protein